MTFWDFVEKHWLMSLIITLVVVVMIDKWICAIINLVASRRDK